MSEPAPSPSRRSFGELYCAQNAIPREAYEEHVFRRVLYPHTRVLVPLLRLGMPELFSADLDLIRGTAFARRGRDVFQELEEFDYHPANVGTLRRVFRLRVSSTRLQRLVRATLHAAPEAGERPPKG
jgi:hypothetical protein